MHPLQLSRMTYFILFILCGLWLTPKFVAASLQLSILFFRPFQNVERFVNFRLQGEEHLLVSDKSKTASEDLVEKTNMRPTKKANIDKEDENSTTYGSLWLRPPRRPEPLFFPHMRHKVREGNGRPRSPRSE